VHLARLSHVPGGAHGTVGAGHQGLLGDRIWKREEGTV
jgi:hypothetical protein